MERMRDSSVPYLVLFDVTVSEGAIFSAACRTALVTALFFSDKSTEVKCATRVAVPNMMVVIITTAKQKCANSLLNDLIAFD